MSILYHHPVLDWVILLGQEAGAQPCFSSQLIGVGNGAGPLAIITYRASAATRMWVIVLNNLFFFLIIKGLEFQEWNNLFIYYFFYQKNLQGLPIYHYDGHCEE